jgi:hypothetical protein
LQDKAILVERVEARGRKPSRSRDATRWADAVR